ncbi:MAG: Clp protease N-terminal domain-containing protein [Patescibacteria group bacterium]
MRTFNFPKPLAPGTVRLIHFANKEAVFREHPTILPEDVITGSCREPDFVHGEAERVLEFTGVNRQLLYLDLIREIPRQPPMVFYVETTVELPFSLSLTVAFDRAVAVANENNFDTISTGVLLIGILQVESVVQEVFEKHSVTADAAKQALAAVRGIKVT